MRSVVRSCVMGEMFWLRLRPSTSCCFGLAIGAVALGRKPGRVNDREITVYKAMGVAMEDMVAANLAYERARREGGGGTMAW